jgi:hypothetical protein
MYNRYQWRPCSRQKLREKLCIVQESHLFLVFHTRMLVQEVVVVVVVVVVVHGRLQRE